MVSEINRFYLEVSEIHEKFPSKRLENSAKNSEFASKLLQYKDIVDECFNAVKQVKEQLDIAISKTDSTNLQKQYDTAKSCEQKCSAVKRELEPLLQVEPYRPTHVWKNSNGNFYIMCKEGKEYAYAQVIDVSANGDGLTHITNKWKEFRKHQEQTCLFCKEGKNVAGDTVQIQTGPSDTKRSERVNPELILVKYNP